MRDDNGPADAGSDDVQHPDGGGAGTDDFSWAEALAEGLEGQPDPDPSDRGVPLGNSDVAPEPPAQAMEPVFGAIPDLNPFRCTEQELIFCQAFAIWENGAEAARIAKFEGGSSTASKLLTKDHIRSEIARIRAKSLRIKETPIDASAGQLLTLLNAIATANPLDMLDISSNGTTVKLKRIKDIPADLRMAVKSIKIGKDGIPIIEFLDRWKAIEMLCRIHGLGSRFLPGDSRPISEQEDLPNELPATAPVSAAPLTLENVVKSNAGRLASSILSGKPN